MKARSHRSALTLLAVALVIAALAPARADGLTINVFPVPVPFSAPVGITAGPDGNVWFVEFANDAVGRITPAGVLTEFPLPTPNAGPVGITAGPDGNLWFTERAAHMIGRITPAGDITEYPGPGYPVGSIAAGSDGNLWFTADGSFIYRITTSGVVTEFHVPTVGASCRGITAGPDGNLWFAEGNFLDPSATGKIGRITPAGVITEFPLPPGAGSPVQITVGPEKRLWFTFFPPVEAIGRITLRGHVKLFRFPPSNERTGQASCITRGPDDNIWYLALRFGVGAVHPFLGRITPDGEITEFPGHWGLGITAGPDGNLWFTEGDGVAQVVMSTVPPADE